MIGKDCQVAADGQVSKMMGSAEEAERFLALLERKVREIIKMPEMWNNMENCYKKSPGGFGVDLKGLGLNIVNHWYCLNFILFICFLGMKECFT